MAPSRYLLGAVLGLVAVAGAYGLELKVPETGAVCHARFRVREPGR